MEITRKKILKVIIYGALFGLMAVLVSTIAMYILQVILPMLVF